jgi:hypothetical protein
MEINWEVYHRVPKFKLLEAAFLWLEIEPSEELLASPPYRVQTMQRVLNDALDDIKAQELIQEAEKLARKEGIPKVDVLKRLFSDPPNEPKQRIVPGYLPKLLPIERSRREMVYEIIRIFGIDSDHLTESSWESLTRDWCTDLNLEKTVSRDCLIKVAEAWNESPKFLFSEETVNPMSDDGFEKGKPRKSSYQKLIEALCLSVNIDLKSKDAVGKIKVWADRVGNGISDTTIRKILDEVETSRLKNSNRRNRKTK